VLLVNVLAGLSFANVFKNKKRLENLKKVKKRKNVTNIKKRKKTFLHLWEKGRPTSKAREKRREESRGVGRVSPQT